MNVNCCVGTSNPVISKSTFTLISLPSGIASTSTFKLETLGSKLAMFDEFDPQLS